MCLVVPGRVAGPALSQVNQDAALEKRARSTRSRCQVWYERRMFICHSSLRFRSPADDAKRRLAIESIGELQGSRVYPPRLNQK
jgi:hypothetical protein